MVWGGEFGRTVYCQGQIEKDNYGRDHHGRCYSIWMAGGGVKAGLNYGETDDYCYNIVKDPVQDKIVLQEYLEVVVRERKDWGDLYSAIREVI